MNCPNCGEKMKTLQKENQSLLHCVNCGASFFEDNAINRISLETAEQLAENRYQKHLHTIAALKKCPQDLNIMKPITNSDAIPRNVILFHCPTCNGVFTGADDLVHFKKAQDVKVDYYRVWEMPLPRLQAVLIIFMVALLTGSVFLGVNTIQRTASYQSQASEVYNTIQLSKSGHYIFINFKTKTLFKSEVVFRNQTRSETVIKPIAKEPTTQHFATFSQFNLTDEIYYRIKLTDAGGRAVETPETKLEF